MTYMCLLLKDIKGKQFELQTPLSLYFDPVVYCLHLLYVFFFFFSVSKRTAISFGYERLIMEKFIMSKTLIYLSWQLLHQRIISG